MNFEAFSFSSIRAAILSGAHSDHDHLCLKKELQPANIIDSLGINSFCFYVNKSFGLLKSDFSKIVRSLKKKALNFNVNEDTLRELDDFYIIKFNKGLDLIEYFQNISMNSTDLRPRKTSSKLMRECIVSDIEQCKIKLTHASILCLDIEIQTNHQGMPTEFGFVYSADGREEHHHYLIEEYYRLKTESSAHLQQKFHFGKTKVISFDEYTEIIKTYLERTDVFIAHSVNSEHHYLSKAGILLNDYVDCVIDTQFVYRNYDPLNEKPVSLQEMLYNLKIGHKDLHNSGNDAGYTWKALKHMLKIKNH